jgi:hypothetical protein
MRSAESEQVDGYNPVDRARHSSRLISCRCCCCRQSPGKRVLNWTALAGSLGNRDLHTIAPASRDTRVSRQSLGRYLSKSKAERLYRRSTRLNHQGACHYTNIQALKIKPESTCYGSLPQGRPPHSQNTTLALHDLGPDSCRDPDRDCPKSCTGSIKQAGRGLPSGVITSQGRWPYVCTPDVQVSSQ